MLHLVRPSQAMITGGAVNILVQKLPRQQHIISSAVKKKACLVSVVNVIMSVSSWKPLKTTVRTLGRPSVRTVPSCMNLW